MRYPNPPQSGRFRHFLPYLISQGARFTSILTRIERKSPFSKRCSDISLYPMFILCCRQNQSRVYAFEKTIALYCLLYYHASFFFVFLPARRAATIITIKTPTIQANTKFQLPLFVSMLPKIIACTEAPI